MGFAVLTATGCSWQLHEPKVHAEGWHNEQWSVHCETAESHSPVSDDGPGVHYRRWIWATTAEGDANRGGCVSLSLAQRGSSQLLSQATVEPVSTYLVESRSIMG